MKQLYGIMAAMPLLACVAAAQDEPPVFEKMAAQVRVVSLQGGIMGKTIKGAPYSGVEVNESTQMLADGTRIHNESRTQVFRDSEGRMRRETPTEITIWDPVANASYMLNPKAQTARKLPMGNYVFTSNKSAAGDVFSYSVRSDAVAIRTPMTEGVRVPAPEDEVVMAKLKAEMDTLKATHAGGAVGYSVSGPGPVTAEAGAARKFVVRRDKNTSESLGKQTIEGMSSEGTRQVSTIEAGAIGNDRAIQSVNERWFSSDLQTVMMTRHTDPRMGEEVFKLINVNRAEPAAYLFQVPAGYQIVEQK